MSSILHFASYQYGKEFESNKDSYNQKRNIYANYIKLREGKSKLQLKEITKAFNEGRRDIKKQDV